MTLEDALAHMQAIAGEWNVPVNADFEGGFAIDPECVVAPTSPRRSTPASRGYPLRTPPETRIPLFDAALSVERVRGGTSRHLTPADQRVLLDRAAPKASSLAVPISGRPIRRLDGVRRGRRGLPLRAGYPHFRERDRVGGAGGGAQAGERAGR